METREVRERSGVFIYRNDHVRFFCFQVVEHYLKTGYTSSTLEDHNAIKALLLGWLEMQVSVLFLHVFLLDNKWEKHFQIPEPPYFNFSRPSSLLLDLPISTFCISRTINVCTFYEAVNRIPVTARNGCMPLMFALLTKQ